MGRGASSIRGEEAGLSPAALESSGEQGLGEEDAGFEVAEEEWEEGMAVGAGAEGWGEGSALGTGWIDSPGTVVHRAGPALPGGSGAATPEAPAAQGAGFPRSKQYVFVAATMPEERQAHGGAGAAVAVP